MNTNLHVFIEKKENFLQHFRLLQLNNKLTCHNVYRQIAFSTSKIMNLFPTFIHPSITQADSFIEGSFALYLGAESDVGSGRERNHFSGSISFNYQIRRYWTN